VGKKDPEGGYKKKKGLVPLKRREENLSLLPKRSLGKGVRKRGEVPKGL